MKGDTMESNILIELAEWLHDEYGPPICYRHIKRESFRSISLDNFAASEVMDELESHSEEDLIEVLENFRARMDNYACIAKTERAKDTFIALYDVATNALNYILCFFFET